MSAAPVGSVLPPIVYLRTRGAIGHRDCVISGVTGHSTVDKESLAEKAAAYPCRPFQSQRRTRRVPLHPLRPRWLLVLMIGGGAANHAQHILIVSRGVSRLGTITRSAGTKESLVGSTRQAGACCGNPQQWPAGERERSGRRMGATDSTPLPVQRWPRLLAGGRQTPPMVVMAMSKGCIG